MAQQQPANTRNPAEHLAEHKWQPGQSGNPGGRPKGRTITARLRDLLEKGEIAGKPIKDGRQVADLVAEVLVKEALKGKFPHLKELLDRVEGKVPDKHEIGGPDGKGLTIRYVNNWRAGDDEGAPEPPALPAPGGPT